MRCFLALELPEGVRDQLCAMVASAAASECGAAARFVDPRQLHLTLLFAGAVEEATVAAWRAALSTTTLPTLRLQLGPAGVFPRRNWPRVFWIGLRGEVDALVRWQRELAEQARALGVAFDEQPFVPHVTLARARVEAPAHRLAALAARLEEIAAATPADPFEPPSFTLFRSEPGPQGARHEALLRRAMR
ncbi:MAG: RNA 2',3'-cyclic phosphodiesterase [Planctomycetes bacterium]|nr:RNA 2',3'-cyclic phosphodiesterase [Planctomycetota bacterium]